MPKTGIDTSDAERQVREIDAQIQTLVEMRKHYQEILKLSGKNAGDRKPRGTRTGVRRLARGKMPKDIRSVLAGGAKRAVEVVDTLLKMASYRGRKKDSVYTAVYSTLKKQPEFTQKSDKTWALKSATSSTKPGGKKKAAKKTAKKKSTTKK